MDSPCGSYVALAASRWAVVASAPGSLLQPCRGAQGPVISHAMVRARQQHLRLLICPAHQPVGCSVTQVEKSGLSVNDRRPPPPTRKKEIRALYYRLASRN